MVDVCCSHKAAALTCSSTLYEEALGGSPMRLRHGDGRSVALRMSRWTGAARGADLTLLERAVGPVLDIGCGPGRLAAGCASRGIPALGIDTAPAAVRLTRQAGACALLRSVFETIPAAGRWGTAMLADGNIGIGGDPIRLLRRVAALVEPGGRVIIEPAAPGGDTGGAPVRLEAPDGRLGQWFPWARVPADCVEDLCGPTGLRLVESWSAVEKTELGQPRRRWFAALARPRALSEL